MKNKCQKEDNHNLPTKMTIVIGISKIVVGLSILFACIMLLVIHASIGHILPVFP